MVPLSFAGQELRLVAGRALFWPREQSLLVADLHLEKASFYAARGQMLPPYDSRETLERLALAIRETGARRVFCLGDNFHDRHGEDRLEPYAAGMLAALMRATDWLWIDGNHDTGTHEGAGALELGGLVLRHRALPGETRPELSGHFHPKLAVSARGRRIARPCAVASEKRMILPAFGAFTGGMNAASDEIIRALQPAGQIDAVTSAAGKLLRYPLWRAEP